MFYITKRYILPGEELLVNYGSSYAELLGINTSFPVDFIDADENESYDSVSELRLQNQRIGLKAFKAYWITQDTRWRHMDFKVSNFICRSTICSKAHTG